MKKFFLTLAVSMTLLTTAAVAANTHVPLGYSAMCLKTPEQCESSGSKKVGYTSNLLQELIRVNRQVNVAITPQPEQGGADIWRINVSAGDCEDYALTKRARLIKLGLPSASLHITVGTLSSGVGHVVLVVVTTKGRFVLDNLNNSVKKLSSTPYQGWTQL